ncbi:unnamed protein product [Musa acuminata subsp. malaccensis]|uniref:(wild Malaysian banana) hypothetical protein n=1 Tax=Musa acuminata subsp. malaccensis TaxID=214687 RepID=A0A804KUM1_MUSAM|nr:unnamed protein product [Musa acuminata subsp. malaccensis]
MPATATMGGDLLGLLARRCTPTASGSSTTCDIRGNTSWGWGWGPSSSVSS